MLRTLGAASTVILAFLALTLAASGTAAADHNETHVEEDRRLDVSPIGTYVDVSVDCDPGAVAANVTGNHTTYGCSYELLITRGGCDDVPLLGRNTCLF